MRNLFRRFIDNQSGVTAIEYGLIASLIAVVIITAVKLVGTDLLATFNAIAANLTAAWSRWRRLSGARIMADAKYGSQAGGEQGVNHA
jgi:pilus assembly protein Flp/PilA